MTARQAGADRRLAAQPVLVTGAAGWIGAHLTARLVEEGANVVAIVRPGTDPWRLARIRHQIQVLPIDLEVAGSLDAAFNGSPPRLCFHLAWPADPTKYLDDPRNLAAVTATLRLVTALQRAGCTRFVGVGTCAEYDASFGWLSESTPTGPRSLYAAAKLATWLLIDHICKGGSMSVAWARLFYQFGPMEDSRRLVPSIVAALRQGRPAQLTAGEQVRDFLHIDDVVTALLAAAVSQQTGPINIGSGAPTRVAELAYAVALALGRPDLLAFGTLPYPAGDPMFICANIGLLRSTGWRPAYTFTAAVADTVSRLTETRGAA